MKTITKLFVIIAIAAMMALDTSAGLPKEMFPHIESDLLELLAPLRDQMDTASRQAHIDRLKALPDWEDRLAKTIVEIAIAARFDPAQPPSASEIDAFRRGYHLQEPLTEFYRQALKYEQKGQAAGAAMEMY